MESHEIANWLDTLKHHADHTTEEVIAAIDSLYANRHDLQVLERASVGDLMQELKWSEHYPKHIQDGNEALRVNPGFYADFVLWVGWQAAKDARANGTWSETCQAQLARERGATE
jgi:hypothetical protein